MKTLYIDCGMGAAGDMLTAALLELVEDRTEAVNELNAMAIPGVEFSVVAAEKHNVKGSHMEVSVNGEVEMAADDGHVHHDHEHEHHHDHEHHHEHEHEHHHDHEHHHEHEHEHHHDHEHHHEHEHEHHHDHEHHHEHIHRNLGDVHEIIKEIKTSDEIKKSVISVYDILADAESKAHQEPVHLVHFHEVGMMDAIADITAACYLMNKISPDKVVATPIHAGNGKVKCAHGILDVPAPATANIMNDGGVPYYKGEVMGELCTPTGAALVRYFADEYVDREISVAELAGETAAVGHGMGYKDFEEAPNCVTVYLK